MNVKILFKERLLRESFFSGWSSGGVRNVVLHVSLCGQVLFSPAKGEYCICSIALESCCEGWREVSYVVREALKSCADRRCFWFVLHIWMLMVAWVHYLLSSVLFSTQSWYPHFWSFKLWFPHLSVFAPSFPISNQSLKPDESLFPFPPSLFAPSFITQIKTVSLYIRWWDSTVGIYRPRSAPRGTLCGGILQSIQLCCHHHLAGASLSSFSISAFHHTGTLVQYSFPPSSFMISKPQPFSQAFSRIPGHIDPSFFIILESRNCCDYCKLLPTVNDPC